jgi:ubiquinone/menaquinone biosynthesis C-methylase UbiE
MAKKRQKSKSKTQNFYDRIAEVQNLALKINGYRDSVAEYLLSLDLDLKPGSLILDAGSGTGIVTMALQDAKFHPRKIVAVDISYNSLKLSLETFEKDKHIIEEDICAVQSNILRLPFEDETFDLVLTCGVLEYVDLDEGMRELSRILKKGSKLVLLPVKPSIVGSVLELLYNFKIHPLKNVRKIAQNYFNIIADDEFPLTQPIAWSKTIFLLEKI